MSIHLVGGGWNTEYEADVFLPFLLEAADRAAQADRVVPRIALVCVGEADSAQFHARYLEALARVAECEVTLNFVLEGDELPSSALDSADGLFVAGGLTPAYHASILPRMGEIRLLVSDGLPYLGFSAGAMIAADTAIIGGWKLDGVPIGSEETGEDLDEITVVEGLGLVDLAVDVHAAQWGTLTRLIAATEAGLVRGGVAIDESTALIVGDESPTVRGAGTVWQVVDIPGGVLVSSVG